MKKFAKVALLLPIITFVTLPLITAAQETDVVEIRDIQGFYDILIKIVGWVQVFFFAIAVLFILFAAFTFLTAGGDAEKLGKAKNQIIYAAIAIAVALLAFGVKAIVKSIISQ